MEKEAAGDASAPPPPPPFVVATTFRSKSKTPSPPPLCRLAEEEAEEEDGAGDDLELAGEGVPWCCCCCCCPELLLLLPAGEEVWRCCWLSLDVFLPLSLEPLLLLPVGVGEGEPISMAAAAPLVPILSPEAAEVWLARDGGRW